MPGLFFSVSKGRHPSRVFLSQIDTWREKHTEIARWRGVAKEDKRTCTQARLPPNKDPRPTSLSRWLRVTLNFCSLHQTLRRRPRLTAETALQHTNSGRDRNVEGQSEAEDERSSAETATTAAKRENHRKKGTTWMDIFSLGRWRSSGSRQQGAIQLAQAFGTPNQPGRPGPVIGVFVCKGPRNELQGLVVASPLSLERFSFEGQLLQRAAPPQPLTCCRGGKIGGVGRVLLCGSQSGTVFIVNAETFELMLELDTKKSLPTAIGRGASDLPASSAAVTPPRSTGSSYAAYEGSHEVCSSVDQGAPAGGGPQENPGGASSSGVDGVPWEAPICSLTINATFAEFAHFVLAGDVTGRVYVWQVPSTKLLLVLPPPELSHPQHHPLPQQRQEQDCCGCCGKLSSGSDEIYAAATRRLPSSLHGSAPHQPRQQHLQAAGGIQAVGSVAEIEVPQEDTDDERGQESAKVLGDCQRDALGPPAYEVEPSYRNAQWLGARPRGKGKGPLRGPPQAPHCEAPPHPQGDTQEQLPSQQDGGAEESLFSGDESGEESRSGAQGRESSVDSANNPLVQSEECLPYIQHAPQELLQQLRAEAQQRQHHQHQDEQRRSEKEEHPQLAKDGRRGLEPDAEARGSGNGSGDSMKGPRGPSGAPSGWAPPPGSLPESPEVAVGLESIPLSPETSGAAGSPPPASLVGDTDREVDEGGNSLPQVKAPAAAATPSSAAALKSSCGSSNCCIAHRRAPCGQRACRGGPSASGKPSASRYVGALLPLAALDQLWVGYGDGALAVFSLSTYRLVHAVQLPDTDVTKLEYAKYRDLIIVVSANKALYMWCPRTLQCIFEMDAAAVTCSSPLSFIYVLEAPEAWELRSTIVLAGCMDGSICVRRLERNLSDGGISCKLVRNYIREVEPQVPISCILVDSWLNAAFVGDASGVVFTLPYVFQLLEAPAVPAVGALEG
ncbi:hypothetical protein cyc_01620 [Cyclospora cayetanensis]|uniref:Uncharacterized protein n=1 Tax=Cyclospora cayetanensis TaxID=88456 RepID=A0A1D3D3Y8_9EIME|nr:hypothetical protein cyc_01620 [Cyclospora cayetanensis]